MTRAAPTTSEPQRELVGTVPDRAHVALYTSSPDSRVATQVLVGLREFATRQGWTVVHKVYDLAPLDAPLWHRTGWQAVRHLLASGAATGLVVLDEREVARHTEDRDAGNRDVLRSWLLGLPAFAACECPRAERPRQALRPARAPQDPATRTAPPRPAGRRWQRSYALHPLSVRPIREAARAHLTLWSWPGDIVAAVDVLARLAYNAVVHARPAGEADARMRVRLTLGEHDTLLLEVGDPRPDFRNSAAAIAGVLGNGLREARLLGAEVSWLPAADGHGKFVRARLPATRLHP
ncbi:ATP-binding protein [Streptomyces shenzhenensis]|uniref:ATP-binding protein n=1 Tax=Streptomyces shenzhenensis TaxID=943815 RepID=UPI0033F9299C